jgi:hypothetical protein
MVPRGGIEPPTRGFSIRVLTMYIVEMQIRIMTEYRLGTLIGTNSVNRLSNFSTSNFVVSCILI